MPWIGLQISAIYASRSTSRGWLVGFLAGWLYLANRWTLGVLGPLEVHSVDGDDDGDGDGDDAADGVDEVDQLKRQHNMPTDSGSNKTRIFDDDGDGDGDDDDAADDVDDDDGDDADDDDDAVDDDAADDSGSWW